jgi:HD-GYP domain-containing protein (c-di-GMP phosphodiesterase class II)
MPQSQAAALASPSVPSGYVEVPTALFIEKVDVETPRIPEVDLFSFEGGHYQCLRRAGEPFSALALSLRPTVWIRQGDFAKLRGVADSLLTNPKLTAHLPLDKRTEALRRTSILVVEDLFENPSVENIQRSQKVVGSFVYLLMKEPKAYLMLSALSSHDPYTLQHSVGTAVNCIILARKAGVTDEGELNEVGLAGLLHDIGKVKVKKEIINKQGPLDELEWEEMRQHSSAGWDIVKDNPALSERTKRAILEHHEDRNGTGYPSGVKSADTHLFSRIVCICDIFNALTTNRSYSKGRTPFEAFQFMREKLAHKIDDELFRKLVLVYGGEV